MPQTSHFLTVCCWGALALLLAACGSSEQSGDPQPEAPAQVATPVNKQAEARNPLADMVKAVPVAAGEQSVELRFELPKQPMVGEPFDINLNVLGLADASGLELKVTAQPDVQVIAGESATLGALKTGESVRHIVQLRVPAAGISVIEAQLIAMIDGNPHTAAFTIPVALTVAPEAAVATATTGK